MVEVKLLLIESVDSLHVLHALLEDLHLLLESNLLLSLVVSILSSELLELRGVLLLLLASLLHVFLLKLLVLDEELLDLLLVLLDDIVSLSDKSLLNLIELLLIVSSHIKELLLHGVDEVINIVTLLLEGLNVFLVLAFELVHKVLDELNLLI